ncbi:MAG: hypothetical protein LBS31_00765 [Candidatus Adiutrix sp.]|jgi:uncharacterized protein with gpF-like domain|nr:hypothetical protein [Candidatus Adiutrix sp.]
MAAARIIKRRPLAARAVLPNAALTAEYHRRLADLIAEMRADVDRQVLAAYGGLSLPKATTAADAAPRPKGMTEAEVDKLMEEIDKRVGRIGRAWQTKSGRRAFDLAEWLVGRVDGYSSRAIREALKAAGFTVKIRNTPQITAAWNAAVKEGVALIRTISNEYMGQVGRAVWESASRGRDLHYLKEQLLSVGVRTERKAELLAKDQNNKATAALSRARYEDAGVTRAIWMHRSGSKQPRQTHIEMNGKPFDIAVGLYDKDVGREIQPAELYYCGCAMRPILPRDRRAGIE